MPDNSALSRRRVIGGVATWSVVLLAGCSRPGEAPDGATDDDPNENEGKDEEGGADDDGDSDAIEHPTPSQALTRR